MWPMKWLIAYVAVVLVIMFGVLIGNKLLNDNPAPLRHLPLDVQEMDLAYKAAESTGNYGHAEYYVITKDGERYKVSRKLYDSLTQTPTTLQRECP